MWENANYVFSNTAGYDYYDYDYPIDSGMGKCFQILYQTCFVYLGWFKLVRFAFLWLIAVINVQISSVELT